MGLARRILQREHHRRPRPTTSGAPMTGADPRGARIHESAADVAVGQKQCAGASPFEAVDEPALATPAEQGTGCAVPAATRSGPAAGITAAIPGRSGAGTHPGEVEQRSAVPLASRIAQRTPGAACASAQAAAVAALLRGNFEGGAAPGRTMQRRPVHSPSSAARSGSSRRAA